MGLAVIVLKNPAATAGDVRDGGSIPWSGRSPGEGNDNPLQYSCLENPMDRGAWRATAHRVSKSRTRLKQWSTHTRRWAKTRGTMRLWKRNVSPALEYLRWCGMAPFPQASSRIWVGFPLAAVGWGHQENILPSSLLCKLGLWNWDQGREINLSSRDGLVVFVICFKIGQNYNQLVVTFHPDFCRRGCEATRKSTACPGHQPASPSWGGVVAVGLSAFIFNFVSNCKPHCSGILNTTFCKLKIGEDRMCNVF